MSMFSCHRRVSSNTRINAMRDWRHHPSKYWYSYALVSTGIPQRSLSRIRSKLVIVSMSIWLSKYHRVSARCRKQQELSSIRESLQRCERHLASISLPRLIAPNAINTRCVFYSVYRKLVRLKWSIFFVSSYIIQINIWYHIRYYIWETDDCELKSRSISISNRNNSRQERGKTAQTLPRGANQRWPEVCSRFFAKEPRERHRHSTSGWIDGAAGSLRAPGPAITSDQTIHKASEGKEEDGRKASGKISSVGVVEGVGVAVAVTTKVLSKLFSRASRVWRDLGKQSNLDQRNGSGRFVLQESKGR